MNVKVSQTSSSSQQKQQGSSRNGIKKHDDKLSFSNDTSNNASDAETGSKRLKKSYQHRHVIADAAKYGSTTDSATNDNTSRGSDFGDDFKGDGDYESGKTATKGSGAAGGKAGAKGSGSSRYQEDIVSVSALGEAPYYLYARTRHHRDTH